MAAKTDDGGPVLPPAIESVWGLRERPPKGPRPGMSVPTIVDAAVRVADADGLAAVSMSRVAKELGAATMALYRYVGSKDELLDAHGGHRVRPTPVRPLRRTTGAPASPGGPGPSTRCCGAVLAATRPDQRPADHPAAARWIEDGLRCLDGTTLAGARRCRCSC